MSDVGRTIGERLALLRSQHGLSLQEVADRVGCTKSHIWELEQGRSRNPTINTAVGIANALGVSLDYLTGLSSTRPNLHPEALRIACEIHALIGGAAPIPAKEYSEVAHIAFDLKSGIFPKKSSRKEFMAAQRSGAA